MVVPFVRRVALFLVLALAVCGSAYAHSPRARLAVDNEGDTTEQSGSRDNNGDLGSRSKTQGSSTARPSAASTGART